MHRAYIVLCVRRLLGGQRSMQACASPVENESSSKKHSFKKRHPLPPLPGNDTWYAVPDNIADYNPGDIIKWRNVPNALSVDNLSPIRPQAVYQMQYRTTDSVGDATASVVTAIIPFNPSPDHLFAYAYFSDSAAPRCNPSLAMQLGTPADAIFTKIQLAPIISALDQGWIVSVADDGGPYAAFPSGPGMGYRTLDSLRAMKQSGNLTGLSSDPTITLNGYSGGGITAAWTGEMHPLYAPELKIDGIALGGLVPDFVYLSNIIKAQQGYFAWGPVTFVGLSHDYRNLSTWLDENLNPSTADAFWATETYCIDGNANVFTNIDTCNYFTQGCESWNDDIPMQTLQEGAVMGMRATPIAPWYLYETVGDQTSPVNITTALYEKYCANGASILYEQNQVPISHSDESYAGWPGAFAWMKERHAGTPLPYSGCIMTDVSSYTIAAAWPLPIIQTVFQTLIATLGIPVGAIPGTTFLP
ncbi:hypothetical protein, variant [Verruconis gallopava]|uniref:Secretory lipase-domain-containing protein n=1 Tax=Verruconis gallopava TaxID=253628 RepID=A0A0D1YYF6_9PEZI|nr:hypothetical protein, variant [Verruconis gallopava]KIW05742.1 hypothetical protein, variant [Verruconis gallopava]